MSAFLSIHRLAMSSQRLRSQSLSSDGSEASFDGDGGSGRSVSGSPQPRTPPLDARGASPPILVPVESAISSTSSTSFFIRDILRPDFGIKREQKSELFPTHPAFVKQEGALGSLSSQRFKEDLTSPRARQVDPAGQASPENLWPAWVFCTRYSDRPSAGPRSRKIRKMKSGTEAEKRPRTAFSTEQLQRLRQEFETNRYLTEQRRRQLAEELSLSDSQIKIWFQNKRAKLKKSTGKRNGLALQLMAQGLYNHSTMPMDSQE